MGKNLGRKNNEELYILYQEGKKLRLSNNILAFLLLSAIEKASNYFTELLLSKCGNPTLPALLQYFNRPHVVAIVRIVSYSRGGACPTDCGSTPFGEPRLSSS